MSQYRVSGPARADLADIWSHIAAEAESAEVADRFIANLVARFPTLAEFPQMGRARDELGPSVRSFPVGNRIIYYRAVGDVVEILRVLHGARDVEQIID